MLSFSKIFIVLGIVFLGLGLLFALLGKIPGYHKIPGDFIIRRENFTLFFPLKTCLLISLILSLLIRVFNQK